MKRLMLAAVVLLTINGVVNAQPPLGPGEGVDPLPSVRSFEYDNEKALQKLEQRRQDVINQLEQEKYRHQQLQQEYDELRQHLQQQRSCKYKEEKKDGDL